MAVTVVLCDVREKKSRNIHMSHVNLGSKVKEFRCQVSHLLNVSADEIVLVNCGRSFKDERSLESYGIHAGSIIHALKNKCCEQERVQPEPMDSGSIQQVVTALQAALMNPAHRNTVVDMMSRPETMENLTAATPGLSTDPVALAMLQDPDLLAILADPDHIHKVLKAHPCLGHAATMVAAAINEESAASGGHSQGTGRTTYSLDQMSDDDEMGSLMRPPAQPITATQLAAALAAAGGGPPIIPVSAEGSSSSGSLSQPSDTAISHDFFQQAMLQAAGGSTSATEQANVSDAALQQLRDMGIADEVRARRALQLTGGDIQAALELLFGDNDL